ncbi:MAG: dienelactone hydrolase family protein [Nitrospiraceae bacterium]
MPVHTAPFTPDQIGTGTIRFPSGAPIPTITDMAVDPYVRTRIPKETQVEGIQFWPQVKGTYPGIVLLHEYWGLNNQIKELGMRLACEGYAVIIPNLYNPIGGMVTANADVGEALAAKLNETIALRDINTCCEFFNTRDWVVRNLHGAVGFGLGGTLATRFACQRKRLRGAVSFYGQIAPTLAGINELYCPLLYQRPEQDASVPASAVAELQQAGEAAKKRITVKTYAGAGYGFCNETRPDSYRAAQSQEAWDAMVAFLGEHLKA